MSKTVVPIEIDERNRIIYLSANFYKRAMIFNTAEYELLQKAKSDNKGFMIKKRIKRNPNKKTFSHLTYDRMENYILKHEHSEECYEHFCRLKEIAKSANRGTGYPTVKKWFLTAYPEYKEFEEIRVALKTNNNNVITQKINKKKAS